LLKIKKHKSFLKDIKKAEFTNQQYEKYINYISNLINGKPLPVESKDHSLVHNLKGFREFHIGGDIVIIYKIENNVLNLVRIGSHSRVFK